MWPFKQIFWVFFMVCKSAPFTTTKILKHIMSNISYSFYNQHIKIASVTELNFQNFRTTTTATTKKESKITKNKKAKKTKNKKQKKNEVRIHFYRIILA